jgi:putative acetyltransferase
MFTVAVDDLTSPDVIALLQLHLAGMNEQTPPEHVHALPLDRLRAPDVTFLAARLDGELAAVGAIKDLGDGTGELKSMRAAPQFRGHGAGRAILLALLDVARGRGYRWVGLETGRQDGFADAHRLYQRHGFTDCGDFADYENSEFSRLMGLDLA